MLVGTVGAGLWRSDDGGETWGWGRGSLTFLDVRVYGVVVDPVDPSVVYAGTDTGLHRSVDGANTFELIDGPMSGGDVWRIAIDPRNTDRIFVGTRPGAIHRTLDRGKTWETLESDIVPAAPPAGRTRLTGLQIHPDDPDTIWACVEVDGTRVSRDGGDSWERVATDHDPDCHWLSVVPGGGRTMIVHPAYVTRTDDGGRTFVRDDPATAYPGPYFREMAVKIGEPQTILFGAGNHVFGDHGTVLRSTDAGSTWSAVPIPNEPNSPIWAFGTHASDPERVITCAHYGEAYLSEDFGLTWRKLAREFTEVRTVAWMPR
jgi:photosystem II stability/assembly factor-like uncharacterized protein